MLTAEQRCRKIKAGAVAWSPTLQKSIDVLRYLRLVISRHRTGSRIHARTLLKAFDSSKLVTKVFSLESAIELLKAEKVLYKTVKINAAALRKTFLAELAEAKALEAGLEEHTVLKQLQQREQQRSLARLAPQSMRTHQPFDISLRSLSLALHGKRENASFVADDLPRQRRVAHTAVDSRDYLRRFAPVFSPHRIGQRRTSSEKRRNNFCSQPPERFG